MRGLMNGNANWGHNIELNNNIISMLDKIGIDTSKEFFINGVSFSIVNGVLQTNGNGVSSGQNSGIPYLNWTR